MADITVHLGRKVGDGKFGSTDIQLSITDSSKEGEKVSDAFDRIYNFLEDKLVEKAKPLLED